MKRMQLIAVFAALSLAFFGCKNGDDDSGSSNVQTRTSPAVPTTPDQPGSQTAPATDTGSEPKETPATPVVVQDVDIYVPDYLEIGDEDEIYVVTEPAGQPVTITCDTDAIELSDTPAGQLSDGTWAFFIKAKKKGTFTVSAKSGDVTASDEGKVSVLLESIALSPKTIDPVSPGATIQLSAVQSPAGAEEKLTWGSSNTDIATVDENGKVTANKPGKVTITAYTTVYSDGSFYNGFGELIADSVELTVKGFFLNDTDFYLSSKNEAKNEPVIATVFGNDTETVTWSSSDENIFKVTPDSTDSKKATLSYVDGASGCATLTAKCGNLTATADVYVAKYSILALGDSISAGYAPASWNSGDKDLEEAEMLATYNKYLNRRKTAGANPNYVNKFCYTNVMYEKLMGDLNCTVNSFAKTGDRTDQLLEKLQEDFSDAELGTKKGEIIGAVREADYITLCIGANDFLKNATASFLISADKGDDNEFFKTTYPAELERCLAGFKTNFDKIIETITADGQEVFVMSVYSPYQHFILENVPEKERNNWVFAGYGYIYTTGLLRLNTMTMEYVAKLNDYIKTKADAVESVHFVDVAATFKNISKSEYPKYIHALPDRFSLSTIRWAGIRGKVPVWFDPHPTIAGESKIADLFYTKFQDVVGNN